MAATDVRRQGGDNAPEIVGHSGTGAHGHGNSLGAMREALAQGVDRIECDVQRSADGDLVLVHDERLADHAGKAQMIRELTTADLRARFSGLLLLDDLVELTGDRVPLMLDVKGPGYERELIDAIERYHLAAHSSVSCTYISTLRRLRRAFPAMRLGLSIGHLASGAPTAIGRRAAAWFLRAVLPGPLLPALRLADATEVMLYHRVATRALIAAVHASGRRVNLWTVNNPSDIHRAIRLRPDGIITDHPDLARALLMEMRKIRAETDD